MLFRSSSAVILVLTIFSSGAFADHNPNSIEAVVDTLLPVNTSQEMCVDTQPENDGFGWNGTCTCRIPGSYEGFGNSIVTDGNRLIVGSAETPNGCIGSGVANVYQIQTDGSLEKETELVSSARVVGDNFSRTSGDFALSGDFLAVAARGYDQAAGVDFNRVTVFSFDGGSWNELYVRDIVDRDVDGQFAINEEELIAVTADNEITRFDINEGRVLQTITPSCPSSTATIGIRNPFDAIDDLLTINISCDRQLGDSFIEPGVVIFRRNAAGEYVTSARLDSIFEVNVGSFESFESFELFELTEDRKVLVDSRRTANGTQHVSWVETAIDTWSFVQPIENLSPAFNVHEGQLFVSDGGTNSIRVYELDAEARNWVQTQTLNFDEPGAGDLIFRTGMQLKGNRLSVLSALGETGSIASLFAKDEVNQWQLLFEERFEDSGGASGFAGNNLFLSLVENEIINIRFNQGPANSDGTEDNAGNISADSCNYSDAVLNGGWGWNAITNQSCAPLENVSNTQQAAQCIDTDGDGWGWDGTTTCVISAGNPVTSTGTDSNCDYSDAHLFNGWGWNATTSQSCAPLGNISNTQPTAQCVDTDGDGWGWDGTDSCIP